tara:strand:- start:500 stop:712 length:213 start_codon:yes stop_codon:yes gene_type:complete
MEVEIIPVGYTQILLFFENHTLKKPKIVAIISNEIFKHVYSLYGSNKNSRIEDINYFYKLIKDIICIIIF